MRNGGDRRGRAADRRRRKTWLLWKFNATCVHCGKGLDFSTIEADRITPGGSYARHNIQASCRPCNVRRGNSPITPYSMALPAAGGEDYKL